MNFMDEQLNEHELLSHAGKISHQMALDKSTYQFEKFKEGRKVTKYRTKLEGN